MDQDPVTVATLTTLQQFNDATNINGMMLLMTSDVVFENTTTSPPDGERHEGHDAFRVAWEGLFQSAQRAVFEFEEIFAVGDRCAVPTR